MDAFPHLNINVKDESIFVPIASETLPLHRPIYAMKTEKGPVGIPVWCPNYNFAVNVFGERTFDRNDKEYFSRASIFLLNSFEFNGAFIVRIGADNMVQAGQAIWAEIVVEDSGTLIHTLTFVTKAISGDIDSLTKTTVGTKTSYPLFAVKAKSPGKYGNSYGITLAEVTDTVVLERNEQAMLKFGIVKHDPVTDTFVKVPNKYNSYDFIFSTKEGGIDPVSRLIIDFNSTLERYFDDNTPAPVDVHVYYDYIKELQTWPTTVGIVPVEELEKVQDSNGNYLYYRVNPFSFTDVMSDADLNEFTAAIDTDDIDTNIVLTNGSDGSLTLAAGTSLDGSSVIETQIENFFDLSAVSPTNPNIVDMARFPFNTIVDTGYGTDVKEAMIKMLGFRKDVKVVLSTWSGSDQNEAESVAVAEYLIEKLRLQIESEIYGTGVFRANIFGQTGVLASSLYRQEMPLTIWYTTALAKLHNLKYIKANPTGLPNSEVSMFKSIAWIPSTSTVKRTLWVNSINYCQNYDMTHLHFPSLMTVYRYDTSVLHTDSFANAVIYIEQLAQPVWAKYAGVDVVDLEVLYAQVIEELTSKLNYMLSNRYRFELTMYQTEEEKQYGYMHHISLTLTGGPVQRVWNLDIICRRPNFEG
jgi:hypothetical protein